TSLFAPSTIELMGRHLRQVLLNLTSAPTTQLGDIELIDAAERQALVETYNRTALGFGLQPLHRLVENQAKRTPDAIALIHGKERMTYAELDAIGDRVARWLVARRPAAV